MTTYLYNTKHVNTAIHILDVRTGKSFCLAENNKLRKRSLASTIQFPTARKLCSICSRVRSKVEAHLKRVKKYNKHQSNTFYESDEWRRLRYQALIYHGRKCQCCGAIPKEGYLLHVDHIKPRSRYPHLALELTNLQVLCKDCNLGKGAWDKTDFRS